MATLIRIGRSLVIIGVVFLALGMICFAAGGRFNSTRSIPVGLYWLTDEAVTKDAYVIFCPPVSKLFDEARKRGYISAGFCPGDYGFMMKRVLASANDRIEITGEGVRINGVPVPESGSLKADAAGRSMPLYPSGTYILAKSELLLMSDRSGTSFDGRYFGPVESSQIKGVIRPVLTW
ncbi:MAG: conjugative transfer signal peptidase TraF [Nitrosospira sp.]